MQLNILPALILLGQTLAASDAFLSLLDRDKKPLFTSQVQGYEKYSEILSWSLGVEQTLNIGSQSSGAGAGKIQFQPLTVTRRVDTTTPTLFYDTAAGMVLSGTLTITKPNATTGQPVPYLLYSFGILALKTMSWSSTDEIPTETLSFEYGSMSITYTGQGINGKLARPVTDGWNRINNIRCSNADASMCVNRASKRAIFEV